MNGSINIFIKTKEAEDHCGRISDAVKSAKNVMVAMKNAARFRSGYGVMSVRKLQKTEADWEIGKRTPSLAKADRAL